jgi:hypothetical protein
MKRNVSADATPIAAVDATTANESPSFHLAVMLASIVQTTTRWGARLAEADAMRNNDGGKRPHSRLQPLRRALAVAGEHAVLDAMPGHASHPPRR